MGRDPNLTVEATWEGGYRCTVATRQFRIRIDEPESAGGGDTGPQPSEVFLASLAGCFTLALYHAAKKRDIELPDRAEHAREPSRAALQLPRLRAGSEHRQCLTKPARGDASLMDGVDVAGPGARQLADEGAHALANDELVRGRVRHETKRR